MISKRHVYFVLGLVIIWSIVPVWATTIPYCIMCIFIALKFFKISRVSFIWASLAHVFAVVCPFLYGTTVKSVNVYQRVVWTLHLLQIASVLCLCISLITLISLASGTDSKSQGNLNKSGYITVPDSLIRITNASYRESIVQGAVQASATSDATPEVPTYVGVEDALAWATRAETRESVIQIFTRVVEDDTGETDNK